jgi:high-affinity iron transporter
VIARALLSYSRRLPIARFVALSSILIAILAVILAGKGIAALQEAGLLDILPLQALPRVEMLGIYPTWQGALAQAFTLIVMLAGFWYTGRLPAVRH